MNVCGIELAGVAAKYRMWILHFLPDSFILWFCNIFLLAGIVAVVTGFFAHRIPGVWPFQLAVKISGIVLLVLGVYFRGGLAVEQEWRERVAEVEARLAVAEKASQAANAALDLRSQRRTEANQAHGRVVKQYITREVTRYNDQCRIPQEFVQAHNAATERAK